MTAFGLYLVNSKIISSQDWERVCALRLESKEVLPALFTRLGLIAPSELLCLYAAYFSVEVLSRADLLRCAVQVPRLSPAFLRARKMVPVAQDGESVRLVVCDPEDDAALAAFEYFVGDQVQRMIATEADIECALEHLYPVEEQAPGLVSADDEDIARLRDLASEAPVIRLVQRLIVQAIDEKASDIHFEPSDTRLVVRLRVDGVLREVESVANSIKMAVISRLKILAQLNIAEMRLPQDGRIRLTIHGRDTDFRVATSPTLHGEAVVLRVLDRRDISLQFPSLGFEADHCRLWQEILGAPHGIVLVTGPTGSGKTTTLYAALNVLNVPDRKILTAEDPIEYTLEGVNQTQIRPDIGFDFAAALRSFLRQDPDVLMVGEIRDLPTARIAVQASLTGHLLLSTLHTNTAATAIARLVDIGIEPFLLSSTLNAVVAQRLVRRLCPNCKKRVVLSTAVAALMKASDVQVDSDASVYEPVGCASCAQSGYQGRLVIGELLVVDAAVRSAIGDRAAAATIEELAQGSGFRTLRTDGLMKCLAGITSVQEVIRVTKDA